MMRWLVGFSCVTTIVNAQQQQQFVKYQTIPEYGGAEVYSFVMGDYGYFTIAGGYNNFNNANLCLQGYSYIYKYDTITQQFIKVYTFENVYSTYDIRPYVIDGQVMFKTCTQNHLTHFFFVVLVLVLVLCFYSWFGLKHTCNILILFILCFCSYMVCLCLFVFVFSLTAHINTCTAIYCSFEL